MRNPERLRRCCARHGDWSTLTRHLCLDFRDIDDEVVIRHVTDVHALTRQVALAEPDALDTAELIVRHQLMLLNGEMAAAARLDPEVHDGRRVTVELDVEVDISEADLDLARPA